MDEILKEKLRTLLRLDYSVEIYNYNPYSIRLSYSHLNSIYNGMAVITTDGYYFLDRQYASRNVVAEKLVKSIAELCVREISKIETNIIPLIDEHNRNAKLVAKGKEYI